MADAAYHRAWRALGGKHCTKNLQVLTIEEHKAKTKLDRIAIRIARGKA